MFVKVDNNEVSGHQTIATKTWCSFVVSKAKQQNYSSVYDCSLIVLKKTPTTTIIGWLLSPLIDLDDAFSTLEHGMTMTAGNIVFSCYLSSHDFEFKNNKRLVENLNFVHLIILTLCLQFLYNCEIYEHFTCVSKSTVDVSPECVRKILIESNVNSRQEAYLIIPFVWCRMFNSLLESMTIKSRDFMRSSRVNRHSNLRLLIKSIWDSRMSDEEYSPDHSLHKLRRIRHACWWRSLFMKLFSRRHVSSRESVVLSSSQRD